MKAATKRASMATSMRNVSVSVPGRAILQGVDLEVAPGECLVVTGRSGSGKTTLLHCLAGITIPDTGEVWLGSDRLDSGSAARRARRRLLNIGLVFQFGELLPELSVLENVALPARLAGSGEAAASERAGELLEVLGLSDQQDARPATLSGGEVQRTAIARALVNDPWLILADEPSGALDDDNAQTVGRLLTQTAKSRGAGVVIATHDPDLVELGDRRLRLAHGRLAAL